MEAIRRAQAGVIGGQPAVLRADGSAVLGMGHIMRMAALARGLGRKGRQAIFVVRDDPAAGDLLQRMGFAFERLPADITFAHDAELTCTLARRLGAEIIVTDICNSPALRDPAAVAAFHRVLRQSGTLIVCFGGADYVDAEADVGVSPYVGASRLANLRRDARHLLLGPSYFVFREEFVEAATSPRHIAAGANRLLITIGGSDPARLTAFILQALIHLDAANLCIRVVVGGGFQEAYRSRLTEMVRPLDAHIEWLANPRSVADLMLWADLAITGDGLTKYETAVTGTPSIMLSRPDSPQFMNVEFAEKGTTLHLGPGEYEDANALARTIGDLRNDVGRRAEMSRRGRELVDGRGLERVLSEIERECQQTRWRAPFVCTPPRPRET